MYLSGSKWNTRKRKRGPNPWRVLILIALIGGLLYINRFVLPQTPPLFVSTPTPTRSPATLVLEAESLFQAGKLSQAEDSYRQAIAIDPQEVSYHIELARVQVFAGKYTDAVSNASNAVLLEPNSAMANAVLAWATDFLALDDPEAATTLDALQRVERAVELDPNSALVRAYYAEVLIDDDLEAYDRAREQAQLSVQLDPNLLEAQRALGYIWERTGNYELAFDAYSNALRINPNLAILHLAMGNMLFNLGEVDEAIQSYTRASSLAPTDFTPLQLSARAYAQVGEYGKASQYAQSAVDVLPSNARLHGDLGRWHYKNGDYPAAIESLGVAIHGRSAAEEVLVEGLPLDPGDDTVVEFYYMYGLALARQDQCVLAGEIALALLAGVPENEVAIFNAQEILIICGPLEPRPTPEVEA